MNAARCSDSVTRPRTFHATPRMRLRSSLTPRLAAAAAVLLAVTACSDATAPVSDVAVYSAGDTLFASVSAGGSHACGLTRGGRAFCWGDNSYAQLGTTATVDRKCARYTTSGLPNCSTVPVPVAGGLRFTRLATSYLATCGLTPSGRAYCWGDALGEAFGTTPTPVPNMPSSTQLALDPYTAPYGSAVCGLASDGQAWCSTDGKAADPVPGGLRFTSLGRRCGVTDDHAVYCWAGIVDTLTFDRGSVRLDTCVTSAGATYVNTAPCSALPVRLRGSRRWARMGETARDCAIDVDGAVGCWGVTADYVLGTPGTAPVSVSFPSSIQRVWTDDIDKVCGIGADALLYCRGGPYASFGNGQPSGPANTVVLAGGGRPYADVSVASILACGVTSDGAASCWGGDSNGQTGSGGLGHDPCYASTSDPRFAMCASSPLRVASIAGLR